MATPLQPREFFAGVWTGAGELTPHPLLRWFVRRELFHFTSESTWLSDTVWLVRDRMSFESGRVLERRMFAELVGADRVHLTADDMPLGADIFLRADGFSFSPYCVLGASREGRRPLRVRCFDECRIDADGFVHDVIRMHYRGFRIATMRIGPISRGGAPIADPQSAA